MLPPADASLLGRVFDQYQNMMQVARCVREIARQRGLARPRLLELSRRDTGLADFAPECEVVRYPTHQDNQPTLAHPVALPFADQAFDACLVTDAYEHIAPEQRPELLREMVRVTRGVVLLACPMETEIVTRFDKLVFDFIWGKYAERYEPLDQHIEFGLEPLADVMASLTHSGAERVIALPDNYIYRWIHQILIYFDLQHRQPHADVYAALNAVYNERLAPGDYREPCYRYLIVGATAPGLDLDEFAAALQGRPETPAAVAAAEGALIEAFHTVQGREADRLRATAAEVDRLRAELRQTRLDYAALEASINTGRAWALVNFLRAVRRRLGLARPR